MITCEGLSDAKMIEQPKRVPGVLRCDQVYSLKRAQRALCHVAKVADRRRDQVQRAGDDFCSCFLLGRGSFFFGEIT